MSPEFRKTNQPAVDIEITSFEALIGAKLPNSYVNFLLHHNGGKVSPEAFSIEWTDQYWAEGNDKGAVSWFFGLIDDEDVGLENNYHEFKERIPSGTLPIADDPGGNLLLLGLSGDRKGHIMFWVMDEEVDWEGGETPDFSNVGHLANSFETFLSALSEPI